MTLVKYSDCSYLNMDMIESIGISNSGEYLAFTVGCNEPYVISEKAFDIILTYGKAK